MLDALSLEELGAPGTLVCTEAFVRTAGALAALWHQADYRLVTVPHPISTLTPAETLSLADAAFAQVERALLGAEPSG